MILIRITDNKMINPKFILILIRQFELYDSSFLLDFRLIFGSTNESRTASETRFRPLRPPLVRARQFRESI